MDLQSCHVQIQAILRYSVYRFPKSLSLVHSSVARVKRGRPPPIISKDEFCDSSKSVEKLKVGGGGGKLHFSPTHVTAWFLNVIKETGIIFLN